MRSYRTSAMGFVSGFYLAFFLPSSPQAAALTSGPQAGAKANAFSCGDVRKALSRVAVHVENIANRSTTRTPEGGPYKRGTVSCESLVCAISRKSESMSVYAPSHPDANKEGYVAFPVIDVATEYAAASIAANELRLLSSKGVCNATSLSSDRSSLIKYDSSTGVTSDAFNFTVDGRLASWSRVNRDGTSINYNFDPDGSIPQKTWNGWINPATAAQAEKSAPKPVMAEVITLSNED